MSLDPMQAARLIKLCGMFSSDHAGERDTAARLADQLVRQNKLTWSDVIGNGRYTWREPQTTWDVVCIVAKYRSVLTEWERKFITDLAQRGDAGFSPKQTAILGKLLNKVRACVELAA
jgi:hypothetical protein